MRNLINDANYLVLFGMSKKRQNKKKSAREEKYCCTEQMKLNLQKTYLQIRDHNFPNLMLCYCLKLSCFIFIRHWLACCLPDNREDERYNIRRIRCLSCLIFIWGLLYNSKLVECISDTLTCLFVNQNCSSRDHAWMNVNMRRKLIY